MHTSIGIKLYCLISTIEAKHNMLWTDSLHRKILMAVLDAHRNGLRYSTYQIVDLDFTSRSSTYRKISDLKISGFISEIWDNNTCYLTLGPSAIDMIADADNMLRIFSAKTD
jgi:hypothetical protein